MNNPRLPFDEARPLSAAARALYDHLCWLGEPAVSHLTNSTMATAIGRSERTVIQALNELAAAELIGSLGEHRGHLLLVRHVGAIRFP